MLTGDLTLQVHTCETLTIHESPYYQLTLVDPATQQAYPMRLNPEAFYPNPQVGDWVRVNAVMGMILGAEKIAAPTPA